MRLEVLGLARRELARAAIWYDRRKVGLGNRLLEEIGTGLQAIRAFPNAHPPIDAIYRRKLINTFPYAIIYRTEGDVIWIIAFSHASRRPGYWRRRDTPGSVGEST